MPTQEPDALAKELRVEQLATFETRWAWLKTPRHLLPSFEDRDIARMATVFHQGLAIAEKLEHWRRLDEARAALARCAPLRIHVVVDTAGIPAVDALRSIMFDVSPPQDDLVSSIAAAVDPVLAALRDVGITRRMLRRFSSGEVLGAAFVLLHSESRGLRAPTASDMEALARICDHRDISPPPPLTEANARRKVRDHWKKILRKGKALAVTLKGLTKKNRT